MRCRWGGVECRQGEKGVEKNASEGRDGELERGGVERALLRAAVLQCCDDSTSVLKKRRREEEDEHRGPLEDTGEEENEKFTRSLSCWDASPLSLPALPLKSGLLRSVGEVDEEVRETTLGDHVALMKQEARRKSARVETDEARQRLPGPRYEP